MTLTHLKRQKILHQLKSADIIRSSYYIHGLWVDEINCCPVRCVINDGPYTLL